MSIAELAVISIGLSMDAFAASVCIGLDTKKTEISNILKTGFFFGLFQAMMPLLGYVAGKKFYAYIYAFDHWIAFGLLSFIGIKMIIESGDEENLLVYKGKTIKELVILSVATSIDALAAGISFALLDVDIYFSVGCIGTVTFVFSSVGVIIGGRFGLKYKNKAEISGGIVLIIMGLKILLEHFL